VTEEDVIDDAGDNAGDNENDPNTIFVDMTSTSSEKSQPEHDGEDEEGKNGIWVQRVRHLSSLLVWPKCLGNFVNFREKLSGSCDQKLGILHPCWSKPFQVVSKGLSKPVIPNQGAAAHRGALRRCQGCRQMFNLLSYLVFYRLGCHKLSFFLPGKGAAKFFLAPKGAFNQKRLENTDLSISS